MLLAIALLAQAPVAIRDVSIIDVATGSVSPGLTILVTGRRITAVGRPDAITVPANATVVEGHGGFVIPGLWDMHVHATNPGLDDLFLPLLLANGITGIRDMWGGMGSIDSARASLTRGAYVGPRITGAGNLVDGTPPIWPGSQGVATPEAARRVVDSLAKIGSGFIKVYSRLSPEAFRAIVEESKKIGIPFAGHVPTLVPASEASDLGQRTVEHLTNVLLGCSRDEDTLRGDLRAAVASPRGWDSAGVVSRAQAQAVLDSYDPDRCRALARRFAKNGTWMVPTITVLRSTAYLDDSSLGADPRLAFIPPGMASYWNPKQDFRFRTLTVEDWARRKATFKRQVEIVAVLKREGVRFLAGTDLANPYIYPGSSLHDELENLVDAGFSPLQALQAATIEPARFYRATDSLGAVSKGYLADLVVLEANPLADITNSTKIRAVLLDGKLYDRKALDALLEAGKDRAKRN
ncbi:MAG TPA: amidohydrolase family protein [Gemmatimonadales bacterium]|nr:amidohydrolase family protein [Gemmatimonadales bacterium]